MNQFSNIFKIKRNKLTTWRGWCDKLNTIYHIEAKESLKREMVNVEAFYLFKIGRDYYTFAIMLFPGELQNNPDNMQEIDKIHRQKIRECLVPCIVPEKLYLVTQN